MEGKVAHIYKNLLRDIRMYFEDKLKNFIEENFNKIKNDMVNIVCIPIVLREYVKKFFDLQVIDTMKEANGFSKKYLYFVFAAFLIPKKILLLFEVDKQEIIK